MSNEKVQRELGEIHTKVDHLVSLVEKQNGRVKTLEGQVSSIRRWQAYVIGVFTALGAGIGSVVSKFFEI